MSIIRATFPTKHPGTTGRLGFHPPLAALSSREGPPLQTWHSEQRFWLQTKPEAKKEKSFRHLLVLRFSSFWVVASVAFVVLQLISLL